MELFPQAAGAHAVLRRHASIGSLADVSGSTGWPRKAGRPYTTPQKAEPPPGRIRTPFISRLLRCRPAHLSFFPPLPPFPGPG